MIRGRVRQLEWPNIKRPTDTIFCLILDSVHSTHTENAPIEIGDDVTLRFERHDDNDKEPPEDGRVRA